VGLYLREYKQREEQELSKIMATQFVNLKWRSTPNMKFLFNENSVVTADLLNDGVELLTPVLGTWKFTIAGKILTFGKTFKALGITPHTVVAGHDFTVTFTPAVVNPAIYKATTITRKVFVTPSLVTLGWSKDQYAGGYWLPMNNYASTSTNFATVNGLKGATQFLGHSVHMGNTPRAIGLLDPVDPGINIGYKYPNYPLPFSGITSDSTYNASLNTMLFNGDTFWWEMRKSGPYSYFYNDLFIFTNATTLPLVNDKISTGFKEIAYNKPSSAGAPRLKYGLQHYTDPTDPHFGYHWMYWSVLKPDGTYRLFFNSSLRKSSQSELPADSVTLYPNINYPNKEATFNPVSYCTGYRSGYAFDSGYYACNNVEGLNVCENFIKSLVSTGVVTGPDITNGRWISTGCAGTGIAGSIWDLNFFTGAAYPSFNNNTQTTLKTLELNGYINKKWRTRMYVGFRHVSPDGQYSRVEQVPVNVEINVKAYNA